MTETMKVRQAYKENRLASDAVLELELTYAVGFEIITAVKESLIDFFMESGETDTEVVQETLDEAVCGINDLQEEFDEQDSEIETVARECIAATVAYILEWFNIPIDTEEALRERDRCV